MKRSRSNPAPSGTLLRVLQNAGWLLAGKAVGAVLSLIYLGLATRTLGVERFGQFALILGTAQAIAAFVGFQTWQLVIRYGMEHFHAGRTDKLADLFAFAMTLDLLGAIVGCGIAVIGVDALGGYFGWEAGLRREALWFAIVILLCVKSTPIGILRLHDRFEQGALADSVTPVVRLIGALAVVATGASVAGFLYAWAVAEVATAIVTWILAKRTAGPALAMWNWRRVRAAKQSVTGLLGFAAVTNVNFTLNGLGKQLPTVAVGLVAGTAAAGQYRLAAQLAVALAKVSTLLARSVFAEFTRVHFSEAKDGLRRLFRSASQLSVIGGTVIVAALFLVGEPVLRLVAGREFVAAYPMLLLLGTAAALDFGGSSFEPTLLATGRSRQALHLRLISSALLLVLVIVLLPRFGPLGAGVAVLAASAVSLLLFGRAAWRVAHK